LLYYGDAGAINPVAGRFRHHAERQTRAPEPRAAMRPSLSPTYVGNSRTWPSSRWCSWRGARCRDA